MCRGGKDGVIKRCKINDRQQAVVNLRKKVKYRADKEGLSPEEWKAKNADELAVLLKETLPVAVPATFQSISETRKLPAGIPENIAEHIEISANHVHSICAPDELKALSGYTGFAAGVTNGVLFRGKLEEKDLYKDAPSWRENDDPPCDFHSKEELVDYINTMDKVLSRRQEEPRILYRGTPIYEGLKSEFGKAIGKNIHATDTEALIEGIQEYYKPGKVFDFSTYLSTTHSAYYAADRTQNVIGTGLGFNDEPEVKGIVFEMKTNAGLDVTGGARSNSFEREVVLPRDTRFRVEAIHVKPESYDTVSGFDRIKRPTVRKENNFDNLAVVVQLVEVDKDGNDILHTDPHKPSPVNFV
jgi:hypothetical protein